MSSKQTSCLVVGGAGFLGQHIVRQLLETKRYKVTVFDIRDCGVAGAETVVGDLRKIDDVLRVVKGAEVVIHVATASPDGESAFNRELMDAVNVKGLYNVIEACKHHGVSRLVYTSSASVVFGGSSLYNADEDTPYTTRPSDYYTATKIEAEKLALAANSSTLAVCALRPSGIFGEGDRVMVPTTIRQAKKGKMKYIIGDGKNMWDMTYVGNVAQAHVLAADKLALGSPLAGRAYFITNQEPVPFWTFMGDILQGLGYDRPHVKLPGLLILIVAMIFQYVLRPLLKPLMTLRSDFTVARIRLVTCNRTYNNDRARKELGYVPAVSVKEGIKRTVAHFAELRADADDDDANGATANGAANAAGKHAKAT